MAASGRQREFQNLRPRRNTSVTPWSGISARYQLTPLHDACVVGDTVGDPFKDTSSVALNPIIKFTTLFGLLAVSLAVNVTAKQGAALTTGLAAIFFAVSVVFVYRSFYAMRIESGKA